MARTITENLFGTHFFSKYYLTILGVILLTVSSKISIPFYPVPMTLQTLVVFFIAASMGMIGFYSTFIYVVLGVLGLPLFANGGGIGYIFSPTFGFLYGMVISAFMIAYILKSELNTSLIKLSATILAGAFVIFLCGISHPSFFVGLEQAIKKFSNDTIVKKSIGAKVVSKYVKLKKRELKEFSQIREANKASWMRKNIIDC